MFWDGWQTTLYASVKPTIPHFSGGARVISARGQDNVLARNSAPSLSISILKSQNKAAARGSGAEPQKLTHFRGGYMQDFRKRGGGGGGGGGGAVCGAVRFRPVQQAGCVLSVLTKGGVATPNPQPPPPPPPPCIRPCIFSNR